MTESPKVAEAYLKYHAAKHGDGKLSKQSVHFESPAKGPDKCKDCVHFQTRTETCEIVVGHVEGKDWCDKFRREKRK